MLFETAKEKKTMTALEFLQDNLEDITFLCQLNNNEKDFKDI